MSWGSGAVLASGAGTLNQIAKFNPVNVFQNSSIYDNGTIVGFGGLTAAFPGLKVSGTNLQLRLADDSGTTSLQIGGNLFPNSQGAVGQVLRTDGAGTLSWVNQSGGITNSAGANIIPVSNGTNIIASSITDNGTNVILSLNTLPATTNARNLGSTSLAFGTLYTRAIDTDGAQTLIINRNTVTQIQLDSTGIIIGGNRYPSVKGTNLQFLQTNGNGTLSWATAVTNSAGNNIIPKSNGNNFIASSLTDDGTILSTTNLKFALGGLTSAFPMLKRSITNIHFRLADDTGFAGIFGTTFTGRQNGTANQYVQVVGDATDAGTTNVGIHFASDGLISWTSSVGSSNGSAADTGLKRNAAAVVQVTNGTTGNGDLIVSGSASANGQVFKITSFTELVTISTAAATTDTTGTIPATSIILGASVRVTAIIGNATTWSLGVGAGDSRFWSGTSIPAVNGTQSGATNATQGPTAATAVRFTFNLVPSGTPQVRVSVWYIAMTAPTS